MMKHRWMAVAAFTAVVAASGAVEVRQIFRVERFQRGDTNVSRLQEIDDASWIWHPTAVERGEVGRYAFLRFKKEFTADAAPLRFDVSADARFELLLDGAHRAAAGRTQVDRCRHAAPKGHDSHEAALRRRRSRGRGDAPRRRERRVRVEGQGDSTQTRTADNREDFPMIHVILGADK